jgi:hypothetical protein
MRKYLGMLYVVSILLFIIILMIKSPFISDLSVKQYIINNYYKFENVPQDQFKPSKSLETKNNLFYYTDITLRIISKNTYQIICWGDRNSILWYFKSDKQIVVTMNYDKIDDQDKMIYYLLTQIK